MTDSTITTADGPEAFVLNPIEDASKAYRPDKDGTPPLLNVYHNNWFGIRSATAAMPGDR